MRNSVFLTVISIIIIVFINACKEDDPTGKDSNKDDPKYVYTDMNYVRITALGTSSGTGSWLLDKENGFVKDYTANDILDMIDVLKPDGLDRFITGEPHPNEVLPTREGEPAMTILQFLNAVINAGSTKCHIIPELDLQWLVDRDNLFWESAQAYYNMSLDRPIRSIYLDNWLTYCENIHKTTEQRNVMLKRLRDIGYTEILADFSGNLDANESGIDGAYLNVNHLTWRASDSQLNKLKSYPNISKVLLHFDSPETLDKFKLNSADKQADIYCNTLYPGQKTQGYNFVFSIIDGDYNSRVIYTSTNYNKNSMFEVTRDLLTKGSFQNLPPGKPDIEVVTPPDTVPEPPKPTLSKRYVRMIVWTSQSSVSKEYPGWMLFKAVSENANDGSWYNIDKDYYAEDVIEIIADLQPTCLDRFITGTGNSGPGQFVPTKPGNPTMTYEQFLQTAMDAGAPGCYIVPKLNMQWLAKKVNDEWTPLPNQLDETNQFWRSAQTLYGLNIKPAIRAICLDCWDAYTTAYPSAVDRDAMFKKLRDIGYTEIHLNYTGATNINNSQIDVAKWNIQTNNWTVNTTALANFKKWTNIKEYLLYIDYPGPMDAFLTTFTAMPHTSPYGYADAQADKLINNIVNLQEELGFIYVYPFFQNGYDPRTFKTDPNGKYKGKSMYEIQKELLWYGKVQNINN